MARKKHMAEEIVSKLRQVDVLVAPSWRCGMSDGVTEVT